MATFLRTGARSTYAARPRLFPHPCSPAPFLTTPERPRGREGVPAARTILRMLLVAAGDLGLHRPQHAQQLVLRVGGDLVLVERRREVLDHGVEMLGLDAHALVRRLHVLARVLARAARGLADLVDE